MREQLLKKQRELLELQKKKIELELLQATASLEQQQRQLSRAEIVSRDNRFDDYDLFIYFLVINNLCEKPSQAVPTMHVAATMENVAHGRPVAPVLPSQTTKHSSKQVNIEMKFI